MEHTEKPKSRTYSKQWVSRWYSRGPTGESPFARISSSVKSGWRNVLGERTTIVVDNIRTLEIDPADVVKREGIWTTNTRKLLELKLDSIEDMSGEKGKRIAARDLFDVVYLLEKQEGIFTPNKIKRLPAFLGSPRGQSLQQTVTRGCSLVLVGIGDAGQDLSFCECIECGAHGLVVGTVALLGVPSQRFGCRGCVGNCLLDAAVDMGGGSGRLSLSSSHPRPPRVVRV